MCSRERCFIYPLMFRTKRKRWKTHSTAISSVRRDRIGWTRQMIICGRNDQSADYADFTDLANTIRARCYSLTKLQNLCNRRNLRKGVKWTLVSKTEWP